MKTEKIIIKGCFLLLAVAIVCSALDGCKKPQECNTSHWPDPDVAISWDECNDVMTAKRYFDCHDSALYNNLRKKIAVCGYVKRYVDPLRYINGLALCADTILTQDNFIILNYMDGSPIPTYDSTCISKVVGDIQDFEVRGCCGAKLMMLIREIEKL